MKKISGWGTSTEEPLKAEEKVVCYECGMEPPKHSWIGHESEVTVDNCEKYGMNDYCFDKYGMAMGLGHWWDGVDDD